MGYSDRNLTETLAEENFKTEKEQKGKEKAHKTIRERGVCGGEGQEPI